MPETVDEGGRMIAPYRVKKDVLRHLAADVKWAAVRALIEYDKRVKLPRRELPTGLPLRHPGVVERRDVMVPMRDGVLLATDVYRPGGGVGGGGGGGGPPPRPPPPPPP